MVRLMVKHLTVINTQNKVLHVYSVSHGPELPCHYEHCHRRENYNKNQPVSGQNDDILKIIATNLTNTT